MRPRRTQNQAMPKPRPKQNHNHSRHRLPPYMQLKILLPFQVFAEKTSVSRIVAETHEGSFGILPHRLDCVAALAPGILTYSTEEGNETYVAVDEGMLAKIGSQVLISV